MIPRELLDTGPMPDSAEPLRLFRRGSEYSIMLGANELMNSRLAGSEEALATLVCERLGERPGMAMLIGGLGMGFTLRAALAQVRSDARITVAELVPAVIAWARGPLQPVFGDCLSDPRVTVVESDVGAPIRAAKGAWDAILLDVDNGPDGLTRQENDRLYDARGLAAAYEALTPGGILAVWSSGPDPRFTRRLADTGFRVEEVPTRARSGGKRGARHMIWLATRR